MPDLPHQVAARLQPWCWRVALAAAAAGLWLALVVAPGPAAVHGQAWRILFLHVPSSWLATGLALASVVGAVLAWRAGRRPAAALALAPSAAVMGFVALVSGALWARPQEGSWWTWEALHPVYGTGGVHLSQLDGTGLAAFALCALSLAAWSAGAVLQRLRCQQLEAALEAEHSRLLQAAA